MVSNKRINMLAGIAAALVVIFLVVVGYVVFHIAYTPLAERMVLKAQPTAASRSQLPSAPQAKQPTATAQPTPKTDQPEATCGATGSQMILFVGEDYSEGIWPKGADLVRLVKVDYDRKTIDVATFPRDMLVKVTGLDNRPESALGLAYYYKKEATADNDDKHRITQATQLVGQSLVDNFNVHPDYYFTLLLTNVPAFIDKIGGVEINNPEAFSTIRKVNFPVGKQTLNGAQAAEYNRALVLPGGDLARSRRQNLFMQALKDKVINAGILQKAPDLVQEFSKLFVTDLSPKQLVNLACLAKTAPKSSITFHQIEGDLVTPGPKGALTPNVDLIKARLKEWLGL